jgi:hypothetical protein
MGEASVSLVSFTIPLLQFDITQHKVASALKGNPELHPRMRICFETESDTRDANLAFAGLPGEMSRSLLNIAKRPLPRLTLRGVGLTSKDAVS